MMPLEHKEMIASVYIVAGLLDRDFDQLEQRRPGLVLDQLADGRE